MATVRQAILCGLAAGMVAGSAVAQKPAGLPGGYPAKPIQMVIPSSPGGGTDLTARPVMTKLSERWGQQVVLEYRAAAAGSRIALESMRKVTPDGYQMIVAAPSGLLSSVLVHKDLPRNVADSYDPVVQLSINPTLMAAAPKLPVKTVKEFVAYARANPGKINWGTSGTGSNGHLAGEYLKMTAGIDMTQVPYKGQGQVVIDLIAGRVDLSFGSTTALMPHARSGKLVALGVTGKKRLKNFPDIPTVSETVPGFESVTWYGVLAPKGTPRAIVQAMNRDINLILRLPEIEEIISKDGAEPAQGSPEEFTKVIADTLDQYEKIIKATGIKFE